MNGAKGSHRSPWLKEGIKKSRHLLKNTWNRKTRRSKDVIMHGSGYKKIKTITEYTMVQ